MPIDRYKVGRAYTARHRVTVSGDSLGTREGAEALLSARPVGMPRRIEPSLQWARWVLEQNNMPLDPNAPIYADKGWRRTNERRSAEWYAIAILMTARDLCLFVDRGEAAIAADLALDLGELVTEANFIFVYMVGKAKKGGKGKANTSIAQEEAAARIAGWRSQAVKYWAEDPRRNQTAVAKKIDGDPTKRRSIVRAIQDLDPRKKK